MKEYSLVNYLQIKRFNANVGFVAAVFVILLCIPRKRKENQFINIHII
jgi:hypothetical protein